MSYGGGGGGASPRAGGGGVPMWGKILLIGFVGWMAYMAREWISYEGLWLGVAGVVVAIMLIELIVAIFVGFIAFLLSWLTFKAFWVHVMVPNWYFDMDPGMLGWLVPLIIGLLCFGGSIRSFLGGKGGMANMIGDTPIAAYIATGMRGAAANREFNRRAHSWYKSLPWWDRWRMQRNGTAPRRPSAWERMTAGRDRRNPRNYQHGWPFSLDWSGAPQRTQSSRAPQGHGAPRPDDRGAPRDQQGRPGGGGRRRRRRGGRRNWQAPTPKQAMGYGLLGMFLIGSLLVLGMVAL